MKLFYLFFLSLPFLNGTTFDPDRLHVFQETFTFDQANIIYKNVLKQELPVEGDIIPPAGLLNHTPLVITNKSGLSADRLFVIGKGQKIDDPNAFFLEPDLSTGICSLVPGNTNNSAGSNISVKLSSLPQAGPNSYFLYVPQMISGRFYISVDRPLYMKTGTVKDQPIVTIDDPSQTTTKDPNYYTLYQNFEFTLDKFYELYANVSNVDFFSLPLQLSSHSFPSGDIYPTLDNLTVVGYPETSSRKTLLSNIKQGLDEESIEWGKLTIPFLDNPYSSTQEPLTDLRIIAAKTSIALKKGDLFKGAGVAPEFFDEDYLTKNNSILGSSFFKAITDYYKNNQLDITIFPANNPEATYTMSSSEDYKLDFISESPNAMSPIQVIFSNPSSDPSQPDGLTTEGFLGGDVGTWAAEGGFHISGTDPWRTEIAKTLSTLFTAGFLPYPESFIQPLVVNDKFLSQYRSQLFQGPNHFFNGQFPGGPWYNVYDQVIHPQLVKTDGVGLGYAFDYDDLLGVAGLLHVKVQSNGVLNPDQPYSTLTIGPIDTLIPDPTVDFGPYTLTINPKPGSSDEIIIEYVEDGTEEKKTIPAGSQPVILNGVKNAFKIRFIQAGENSLNYLVYPKYQLVLPTETRYNEEDVYYMNGIAFQSNTSETSITISLPPTYNPSNHME